MSRDLGADLPEKTVERAYWERRCPRCRARAAHCGDREWAAISLDCKWLGDDVRGGFRCNERWRNGPDARK